MPHRFTIPDFVILNPGQTDPRPLPVRVPVARRDPGVGVLGPLGFVFDPKRPLFEIPGVPRGPVTNPFGIPGFGGTASRLPQGGDAVFRRGLGPRLSGIGAILIFGLEIIIREANRDLDRKVFEELAGQKALEERAARVRRRDRDIRTIEQTADLPTINPDAPGLPLPDVIAPVRTLPEQVPLPDAPLQPDIPTEIQFPAPDFGTSQIPEPVFSPVEIPNPAVTEPSEPAVFPNPGQFEIESPSQLPDRIMFPFPLQTPVGDPLAAPIDDPLTSPEPISVPLQDPLPGVDIGTDTRFDTRPQLRASPQAAPQTPASVDRCPPRQCDDELEEPRVECFKGLYREGVLETDFTSWSQIDCITGKEL